MKDLYAIQSSQRGCGVTACNSGANRVPNTRGRRGRHRGESGAAHPLSEPATFYTPHEALRIPKLRLVKARDVAASRQYAQHLASSERRCKRGEAAVVMMSSELRIV
jgi:hypothetical protein